MGRIKLIKDFGQNPIFAYGFPSANTEYSAIEYYQDNRFLRYWQAERFLKRSSIRWAELIESIAFYLAITRDIFLPSLANINTGLKIFKLGFEGA